MGGERHRRHLIGAKNPAFQPWAPQSHGPDATIDTRIEGQLCAALSRLIEAGKKRKEASETIARAVKRGGIKAAHPRRRVSEQAEDYEWTGPRVLRLGKAEKYSGLEETERRCGAPPGVL
jgi:hypothetical protein